MKNIIIYTQLIIFIPIIISVFIYILNKKYLNPIVFLVQAFQVFFVYKVGLYLTQEGIIRYTLGSWSKIIGVELRIDSLSFMFLILTVIIWWIVLIYAWYQQKHNYKFLFFLMFLEGCFNAFVMANDFFTLFVLIEIITIISSILILYKKDGIAIKAALYYLLFNSFGMVIYLFGLVFLYLKVGTVNVSAIADILAQTANQSSHTIITLSFACFFAAMCVKAAFFPVYDWLPRAHTAAPAYISALLSALLVKSGLYGLMRLLEIYYFIDMNSLLFYLGFFTALSGFVFALSQKDIKAILAFSTISQIGLMVMSLASGSSIGLLGAELHIVTHFFYKSVLFLGAGIIINLYGFRRITEIKGIARAHPILSICMIIAILSSTGAPFFFGFYSKSVIKLSMVLAVREMMFQIVSIGTLMTFIKFSRIFFGQPIGNEKIRMNQSLSIVLMTVICIGSYFVIIDFIPVFKGIDGSLMGIDQALDYLKKITFNYKYILDYFILVLIAFLLNKLFVRENHIIWYKIRHFSISFQNAIVFLMVFLIMIIQYI